MNSLIYLRGSVTTEVSAFIKSGPDDENQIFWRENVSVLNAQDQLCKMTVL